MENQNQQTPTAQVSNQMPSSINTSSGSKLIPIIFGIVVVVAIAIGAYVLGTKQTETPVLYPDQTTPTPTPIDETANWKTYTDEEFELMFNYPQNWEVISELKKESGLLAMLKPVGDKNAVILLLYQNNPSNLFLKEFEEVGLKKSLSGRGPGVYSPNSKAVVLKSGITTYYSDDIPCEPGGCYKYIIPHKNLIFEMRTSKMDTNSKAILDQILSTFKFTNENTTQVNGVSLENIKYTLPQGWKAEITKDGLGEKHLFISPGGGYLSIKVYNYIGTIGRREYYCQVRKVCIEGTTYYTEMALGNISGYMANALDNSGSGAEYFGSKGDKFYVIGSYTPPSPNEFEKNYKKVLDSLVF